MANYDFKQLSPHEFEQLTRDLIQERDGIILESFKSGRDSGIDFRYARANNKCIVQCKHYAGTGFSGLMTELRKEVHKAHKLNPTRYILVTSVGLSPNNKQKIQTLFGNILTTPDILGLDDLNNLLGIYSKIEQQHYKLWLTSTAVFNQVLHNESLVQSGFDIERVRRDIHRYVSSSAYPKACDLLEKNHVVIISGVPGVGKTTLAKMLLYTYLQKGYEPISILTDITEGRKRFQHGIKQIFYFDDFIGATFLGERASTFARNEDRSILDFIELVHSSNKAKLVMTTREHIFQQAIAASEKLIHSNVLEDKYILKISDYNQLQRAEILYNHIYFSELSENYRKVLLANRFYKKIIEHKNFNPRLIEWLSSHQRICSIPPDEYQQFILNLLANPAEIWLYAYENQISDAARGILLSLHTYNGKCEINQLEKAFQKLHGLRAERYGFKTDPSDWRKALRELTGSFILSGESIEVIDPSVLDMLNSIVRNDTLNAFDMIDSTIEFEQVHHMWRFAVSDDSATVLDAFKEESDRVANAFENLLLCPSQKKVIFGNAVLWTTNSIKLRLCIVIEVADKLESAKLQKFISSKFADFFSEWEKQSIDIDDGIALLNALSNSKMDFEPSNEEIKKRLIFKMANDATFRYNAKQLYDLIYFVQYEDYFLEFKEIFYETVEEYMESYFETDLEECGSEDEYESFEWQIREISDMLGSNLDISIETINEEKLNFQKQQEEEENEDTDSQYELWREIKNDIDNENEQIDDLFDSLHGSAK